LCRGMDIVFRPRIWDHGALTFSFEARPTFQTTAAGRVATPPTPTPPHASITLARDCPISSAYMMRKLWDIEQQTSASGTLLRRIYISLVLRTVTHFIHLALDRGRINLAVERLPNLARPPFARVPQSISVFQGCGGFGRHRCRWFFSGVETLSLMFTGFTLSVTGRDEPRLWYRWVQRHCWVGSGEYIPHRLSHPDCHADAVAGVAHRFRNIGLWEATVACAVRESFECLAMVVAFKTYIKLRARAVVWGCKIDSFRSAR